MVLIFTTHSGLTMYFLMRNSRSCPPAKTRAPSPYCARSDRACSVDEASTCLKLITFGFFLRRAALEELRRESLAARSPARRWRGRSRWRRPEQRQHRRSPNILWPRRGASVHLTPPSPARYRVYRGSKECAGRETTD